MVLCISAFGQNTANEWFEEGRAFLNQSNYDDAILAFDKAIKLEPQYIDAWKGKGSAYLRQEEYAEAVKAFDKAIELDPQLPLVWSNKGYALLRLGRYDEALQAYDKAIELDPEYGGGWDGKGHVLCYQGKYDGAIQAYDKAIELYLLAKEESLAANAWNSKGVAFSGLGRNDEAIKAYGEAIKLDPQALVSWYNINQRLDEATANLTAYTYSRLSESTIIYSNESIKEEFQLAKKTDGKADLLTQSGWWNSSLIDNEGKEISNWEGYYVNGSEYWKVDQNWTTFVINDTDSAMRDYNELYNEANLLDYSNMTIVGLDNYNMTIVFEPCGDEECYKLTGSPLPAIYKGVLGLQILAAYIPSPFPLPEELKDLTFDMDRTRLLENSNITVTAWISKDKYLLKRMDVNSRLTISPEILNISSPDFKIESSINESTVYRDFGSNVKIVLPIEAQSNKSSRFVGTDWRWAAFGSMRP
jgi:tetratricopeptide (TPR) repeat protein